MINATYFIVFILYIEISVVMITKNSRMRRKTSNKQINKQTNKQTNKQPCKHFNMFFVCLFGVYRPTREFSTHVETSTCSNEVTERDLEKHGQLYMKYVVFF